MVTIFSQPMKIRKQGISRQVRVRADLFIRVEVRAILRDEMEADGE